MMTIKDMGPPRFELGSMTPEATRITKLPHGPYP